MAPRSGLVATSTYVSIIGSFPAPVSVWFGDQPGSVDFQSDSWLLVRTPLRSDPALVDVTLRRSGAVVLSVADAFVFQAAAGDPPVVGPGPTTSGPTGTTTSPTASSTLSPTSTQTTSPTAGTAPGGTSPADTGAGGGGDGPVASLRRQRATALSEPIELGNGLLVTPLSGLGAVRDVATCRSDPCRARSI
jgi:hypothetical protein